MRDFLLERIESILESSSVHEGIIFEDIKPEIKPLVSEQLEIRFNCISESVHLQIIPWSQEKLIQEKQQECFEVQESVLIFIC